MTTNKENPTGRVPSKAAINENAIIRRVSLVTINDENATDYCCPWRFLYLL